MRKYKYISALATVTLALLLLCTTFILTIQNRTYYKFSYKYMLHHEVALSTQEDGPVLLQEAKINYSDISYYLLSVKEPVDFHLSTYSLSNAEMNQLKDLKLLYTIIRTTNLICLLTSVLCILKLSNLHRFKCLYKGPLLGILLASAASVIAYFTNGTCAHIFINLFQKNENDLLSHWPTFKTIFFNGYSFCELLHYIVLYLLLSIITFVLYHRLKRQKEYQF